MSHDLSERICQTQWEPIKSGHSRVIINLFIKELKLSADEDYAGI